MSIAVGAEESWASRVRLYAPEAEELIEESRGFDDEKISSRMKLSSFLKRWFIPIVLEEDDAAATTLKAYKEAMDRWIAITNDPPICQIDDFTIAQFRKGLKIATFKRGPRGPEYPLSPATQSKILTHIRFILYRVGPCWDPKRKTAALVEKPLHIRISKPKTQRRTRLTMQQARRVIAATDLMTSPKLPGVTSGEFWRLQIAAWLYTNARSGTVRKITQEHLVVEDGQPWIKAPGSINRKTGKPTEVPLHPCLQEAMAPFVGSRTMIPKTVGKRHLARLHYRLQTLAGIPKPQQIQIHGWRRVHASELAMLGAKRGLEIAQKSLAHSDSKTTEDSYCDVVNQLIPLLPRLWDVAKPDDRQALLF